MPPAARAASDMRFSMVRRSLIALATLVVLALALVAALPWVASTQIVRDRIAYELSLWSGYRVSLGAAPVLDVWPNFKAELQDVAFHEWDALSSSAVLRVERMEVSLSAVAALRGDIVFAGAVMHSPVLRLAHDGVRFELPGSPSGGRMSEAIAAARAIVATNPASPDRGALPSDIFGTVEFLDGRISFVGGDEGDVVSGLRGKIVWPSLNRGASLTATGIWRGEELNFEASAADPLMLLAESASTVKAAVRSSLLTLSFDGTASFAGEPYLDGQWSLASPSLQRMLEWSRTEIAPGAAVGAFSLAGHLQGSPQRMRLDQAAVTLGGNSGQGVLDVSFAHPAPSISGTLAFDRLDLRSFVAAFAPIAGGEGDIDDPIDIGFADQLSLDIRLSATAAALGSIALSDVAAAAQVRSGLATFDISDATAFDGMLQASIRIDSAGEGKAVEMRLMADDVDAFAMAKAFGSERLVPQGRASFSTILKGTGGTWRTALGNAEGSVSASIGQGALVGFDLARFRERATAGGFFALSDVSDGTVPFRSFSLKARVVGGVARVERADFQLDGQVASLSGIVPYLGRALALSGQFAAVGADGARGEPEANFFIGGAWDAPYLLQAAPTSPYE